MGIRQLTTEEKKILIKTVQDADMRDMINIITQQFKRPLVPSEIFDFINLKEKYTADMNDIVFAVDIALKKGTRNMSYIEGVLKRITQKSNQPIHVKLNTIFK